MRQHVLIQALFFLHWLGSLQGFIHPCNVQHYCHWYHVLQWHAYIAEKLGKIQPVYSV